MESVKVSVIIPVYNVEQYLRECLESVVNQTLDNMEVIIVNDGSTDNSSIILNEYEEKYKFIKIINKKNEGLGAARNTGLEYAIGEYVAFLDSDDVVDINMYKTLYDISMQEESDIVCCNYEEFEDIYKLEYSQIENLLVYNNIEAIKLFLTKKIQGYAWNKIYKRDLIINNELLFPEQTYYEDMILTVKSLYKSNKVICIDNKFYKYRKRQTSISNCNSIKHLRDYVEQNISCIEYCKSNIKNIEESLIVYVVINQLTSINWLIKLVKGNIKEFDKQYNVTLKELGDLLPIGKVLSNRLIINKYKFIYILLKLNIYKYIAKLNIK